MTLLDSPKRHTTVVAATGDTEGTRVRMPEHQHPLEIHAWRGAFTNRNRG